MTPTDTSLESSRCELLQVLTKRNMQINPPERWHSKLLHGLLEPFRQIPERMPIKIR